MFPMGKKKNPQTEEFALNPDNNRVGQRTWKGQNRSYVNPEKKVMREKFQEEYVKSMGDVHVAKTNAGYSPRTGIQYQPEVKEAMTLAQKKLWEKFDKYADEAFEVQLSMMRDEKCSYKVKFDITSNILDRAGYKPAERREVVGAIGITGDSRAIGEFADRARALLANRLHDQEHAIEDAEVVSEVVENQETPDK